MFSRLSARPDRQSPLKAQGRRHRGRIHILRELALVGESVHDWTILGQLQRDIGCYGGPMLLFLTLKIQHTGHLFRTDFYLIVGCCYDHILWREVSDVNCKLIRIVNSFDISSPTWKRQTKSRKYVWLKGSTVKYVNRCLCHWEKKYHVKE